MKEINYNSLSIREKVERQKEIIKVFLRLGFFAFGGPAAHIAMMEEEIINKRKWINHDKFMDLIGATNLIPSPNSTEIAIFIGHHRGGILGLFLAGISFIIPAMGITLLFAIAYVKYGSIPQVESLFYGMKSVIIAIILQALLRLGKSVIKNKLYLVFGLIITGLSLLGIREIPLLLMSGLVIMVILNRENIYNKFFSFSIMPLSLIFLTFLKIGAVLYGSGYVLLAFLESEFIKKVGVLTNQQLIDAVAVGQFTPGPVFTTATFIGYLLGNTLGAVLATIGIFIPSFLLVIIINPIIPRLRKSIWVSSMLDGINIASLSLMAVVTFKLGIASLIDGLSIFIFAISLFAIMKYKISSFWLIIGGSIIGWISSLI